MFLKLNMFQNINKGVQKSMRMFEESNVAPDPSVAISEGIFGSGTTWFLDVDDFVRINRTWLHKNTKVLDLVSK